VLPRIASPVKALGEFNTSLSVPGFCYKIRRSNGRIGGGEGGEEGRVDELERWRRFSGDGEDGDEKDFAMRNVDELSCGGGEGNTEFDAVEVVEGQCARKAIAVLRVGTMNGEERVGRLRQVAREGRGVVDLWSEECGVADGHEDVWQDEPGHLGTLL
jgi:hypothetical protein